MSLMPGLRNVAVTSNLTSNWQSRTGLLREIRKVKIQKRELRIIEDSRMVKTHGENGEMRVWYRVSDRDKRQVELMFLEPIGF